jgi:hypothetical protein
MEVEGDDPGAFPGEDLRQSRVERPGPLVGVVRKAKLLGRFPVDADDDGITGRFHLAPQPEQQTKTRVFLEVERERDGRCQKTGDTNEKTYRERFQS